MKPRSVVALLIGALAVSSSGQSTSVPVLSARSWKTDGQDLQRGGSVKLDGDITANAPGGLLLDCPTEIVAYSCRATDCKVRACGPAMEGTVSRQVLRTKTQGSGGWMDALLRREPREPIVAVARAGGNPTDAVLLADSRGIHWGPALTRVLEGRHCFRVTPLPANATAPPVSFALEWDRIVDATGARAVPNVSPGLYLLEKGRPSTGACEPDTDGVPAWVLIAPVDVHERVSAAWRTESEALSQRDTDDVDVATMRAMRHAVLAVLADQAR